jgi:hypothetical protein
LSESEYALIKFDDPGRVILDEVLVPQRDAYARLVRQLHVAPSGHRAPNRRKRILHSAIAVAKCDTLAEGLAARRMDLRPTNWVRRCERVIGFPRDEVDDRPKGNIRSQQAGNVGNQPGRDFAAAIPLCAVRLMSASVCVARDA